MDVIDRIDEFIAEAEKHPEWTAVEALQCLRRDLRNKCNEQPDGVLEKIYNMFSVR